MTKKSEVFRNEIKLFLINTNKKSMSNISNNQFELTSSLEIPKIRPFCNLKITKIAKKNVEKYFQHQFWKVQHAQNILKITPSKCV